MSGLYIGQRDRELCRDQRQMLGSRRAGLFFYIILSTHRGKDLSI